MNEQDQDIKEPACGQSGSTVLLAPMAWLRDAGEDSDELRPECITNLIKNLCLQYRPAHTERYTIPLYRLTDDEVALISERRRLGANA